MQAGVDALLAWKGAAVALWFLLLYRLFHSRSRHARSLDMAIGVEAREEEALVRLLAAPFRPAP